MRKLMAIALCGALALAACGGDDEDEIRALPSVTPGATQVAPPADDTDGNAPGIPELRGEIVQTASGLRYIDEEEGSGEQPAGPNTCVTVHYTGWLTDGTKFDSSRDRGQTATFPLSGVIGGWTEGVGSMKVGAKRRLIIPPSLGYGAAGRPPRIPGNSTLIFDVELVAIAGEATVTSGRAECPA